MTFVLYEGTQAVGMRAERPVQCLRLNVYKSRPTIKAYGPTHVRTMSSSSEKDAKKALRKDIKELLSNLGEEDILTQSKRAQDTILSLQQYKDAQRVGIYLSMPRSEAQTDHLIRDAFKNDKHVFVPYLHSVPAESGGKKRKIMDMLRLNSMQEYETLEHDSWGIPSLAAESVGTRENGMGGLGLGASEDGTGDDIETLDMLVVPGVAFDRAGARTGHGAGFYDAFLSKFRFGRIRPYLGEYIPALMPIEL